MSEWKDQLPIKGLGNNIDMDYVHNGAPLGIKRITPPLPTEWANLYSSWNLDFVTGLYPCVPMMWAKLLAPVVLGTYHELDPGLYMAPRIFALYMTIQYQIFTVVDSGIHTNSKVRYYQMPLADGTLREHTNWEIKLREVSDLWGDINQEAAKQLNDRFGVTGAGSICACFQHIHERTRTHAHAHTPTHAYTHTHTDTHAHAHAHALARVSLQT